MKEENRVCKVWTHIITGLPVADKSWIPFGSSSLKNEHCFKIINPVAQKA